MLDTHIKDCDAILCTYAFKVRKGIIEKAKKLKIIANFGVGIDNIDIEYAKAKIYVSLIRPETQTYLLQNSRLH